MLTAVHHPHMSAKYILEMDIYNPLTINRILLLPAIVVVWKNVCLPSGEIVTKVE